MTPLSNLTLRRIQEIVGSRRKENQSPEKERHAANELPARAENRFFRKVASRWCLGNYKTVHWQNPSPGGRHHANELSERVVVFSPLVYDERAVPPHPNPLSLRAPRERGGVRGNRDCRI